MKWILDRVDDFPAYFFNPYIRSVDQYDSRDYVWVTKPGPNPKVWKSSRGMTFLQDRVYLDNDKIIEVTGGVVQVDQTLVIDSSKLNFSHVSQLGVVDPWLWAWNKQTGKLAQLTFDGTVLTINTTKTQPHRLYPSIDKAGLYRPENESVSEPTQWIEWDGAGVVTRTFDIPLGTVHPYVWDDEIYTFDNGELIHINATSEIITFTSQFYTEQHTHVTFNNHHVVVSTPTKIFIDGVELEGLVLKNRTVLEVYETNAHISNDGKRIFFNTDTTFSYKGRCCSPGPYVLTKVLS